MTAQQQPQPAGDDWMDVANATGVGFTFQPNSEWTTQHRPHPTHAHEFTDTALAAVLANWSRAAAGVETDLSDEPVALVPVADHGTCESVDCRRPLCACPDRLCEGFYDTACAHGHWLCEGCRGWCPECRVDALDDAQGGA